MTEMEKKYFIDSVALKRLLDPQQEIRYRTLQELTAILNNNILFTHKDPRGNGDELSVVSLDILTRNLIRWFQFRPVQCEAEVLDLLLQILRRKDFLRHVVKNISASRLKKEFQKIANLILSDECYTKLREIFKILSDYEASILIDVANKTGSFSEVDSPTYSQEPQSSDMIGLVERMLHLRTSSQALSVSASCETNNNEVETDDFWGKLDGFDLDTFNGIDAELSLFKENEHLSNVLKFLSSSVHDFPAEFFLQPPNILESLLSIIPKVSNDFAVKIVTLIKTIVNNLKDRWMTSTGISKQGQGFVAVKNSFNNILQVLTDYFERFHDSFSPAYFRDKQEVLNEIYHLLFDIASFIKTTNGVCQPHLNSLMNMIASVAKDLRICYATALEHSGVVRLHYMVCIYIINVLASTIETKKSSDQHENNIWEFECDAALLDVPLKIASCGVYSLLQQNRKEMIKTDEDLSLLLNCQKSFAPMVHLFQDWEDLDDETIVLEGVEALSTIRFHKSNQLVALLLSSIDECSEKFASNKKLEKAAQEIYLRLLSVEIPEVRRMAYSLAQKFVQKRIQEGDFDDPADNETREASICSVFGIPITNEIVTEILCFGYTDSNPSIRSHSRTILFGILRSKITCGSHWMKILNVIRPVLPLMTSFFAVDEQMGFFSVDIYNCYSGSGFEHEELDRAFARYLFCRHPKARNIAKKKLLGGIKYSDEMINIIPDDFCVIPAENVTEMLFPEPKLGYDSDSYKTVHETLKTDRSDRDLLKSSLLQLSVLMNSRKLCIKSHDDNVWIFFMSSLDMGFPNDPVIRKLTINIIFKWAVSVPDFRMYLANEAKGLLHFLVTTLVYFQEDQQIKTQTSWLLFLLLFSDFIVTSDRTVSMPQILSTLHCPFKTQYHWTESPFNQISALEDMYGVMSECTEGREVFAIAEKFLKFTFALEWFNDKSKLVEMNNFTSEMYYEGLSVKTLKVSQNLQLSANDIIWVKQTSSRQILKNLCLQLENTSIVQHAQNLIYLIQNILILPVGFGHEGMADLFDQKIERLLVFSKKECQQKMLVGFLQIYQKLMMHLKDDRIVNIFNKQLIKSIINNSVVFPDEVYIEGLNLINCVVRLCSKRPSLMNELIKSYEKDHKIHMPSKIVEKLTDNLFDGVMSDKKWQEASKRPCVQAILNLLRNVMCLLPIHLDEAFLNKLFDRFIKVLMPLYRSCSDAIKEAETVHIYSNTVKQIFSILLEVASNVKHLELGEDHYKSLMFWAGGKSKKYKELPWMIIAKVTSKKENFDSFCNGLEEACEVKLLDTVMISMMRPNKNITDMMLEQKALVIVLANILEHRQLCGLELRSIASAVEKLVSSNNMSALSFIIKSMVDHNFPKTVDLVVNNEILSKLLFFELAREDNQKAYLLISEQIETFITCLRHKPLEEHAVTTLLNFGRIHCTKMLRDSNGDQKSVYKRFNHSVFNLLHAMIQSQTGLMRLCQIKSDPTTLDRLMFASHDNLRTTNPHRDLVLQLSFWNSLLDASVKFDSPFFNLLSTHVLDRSSGKCIFMSPPQVDEKRKVTNDEILEKNFKHVHYAIDLLFLQVVNIFVFIYSSKFSTEYKFVLKSACFVIIKKLISSNTRVNQLAAKMNLISIVNEKLAMPLSVTQSFRHLQTTKKYGVKRATVMIKDLCITIKVFTEWNLPLESNPAIVKDMFSKTLKISDWLNADSTLMNCFMQLIQVVSVMEIGRHCVMQEIDGVQLPKFILSKTQLLSSKPPHTQTNLTLIANGIAVLKTLSRFVEVRMILKNAKLFQMLEVLHPQIQKNRKTTWDDVTVEWMKFFEFLSRYEDTECLPSHISLLCRMFRLGNSSVKRETLTVIKNFSARSSIGNILLSSDDFPQTVDSILVDSKDDKEKLLIMQTLMNIVTKSEQSKAKLKNSPLNRKLKDQLRELQSSSKQSSTPEQSFIRQLTNMLISLLYPRE